MSRYRFAQDDDGHWYLLPIDLEAMFFQMLDDGESDGWEGFNTKFYQYNISSSPSGYTFTNPEER